MLIGVGATVQAFSLHSLCLTTSQTEYMHVWLQVSLHAFSQCYGRTHVQKGKLDVAV